MFVCKLLLIYCNVILVMLCDKKCKLKIGYSYFFFLSVFKIVCIFFRMFVVVILFFKGSVFWFIVELVLSFNNLFWGGKWVEFDGSSSNFFLVLWFWYEDFFFFLIESNEFCDVFNEIFIVMLFLWVWKFKLFSVMFDNISREFVLEVGIFEIIN